MSILRPDLESSRQARFSGALETDDHSSCDIIRREMQLILCNSTLIETWYCAQARQLTSLFKCEGCIDIHNKAKVLVRLENFGQAESLSCPGWRGAVQILSTVPTVVWVLLGSGESNKGQEFGSLYMQLVCRRTLPLPGNACNSNSNRVTHPIVQLQQCQGLACQGSKPPGLQRWQAQS